MSSSVIIGVSSLHSLCLLILFALESFRPLLVVHLADSSVVALAALRFGIARPMLPFLMMRLSSVVVVVVPLAVVLVASSVLVVLVVRSVIAVIVPPVPAVLPVPVSLIHFVISAA